MQSSINTETIKISRKKEVITKVKLLRLRDRRRSRIFRTKEKALLLALI